MDATTFAEAEQASTTIPMSSSSSTQSAVNLNSNTANSRHYQQWRSFLAKSSSKVNADNRASEDHAGNVNINPPSSYRRE